MNRISARTAGAFAGLALLGAVAGCSAATSAETTDDTGSSGTSASESPATDATTEEDSGTTTDASASSTTYADGEYTATGSYSSPGGTESVTVTLTLADDVVTDLTVTGDTDNNNSARYQSAFIGGITDLVVGKSLDEIDVDVVAGSSLTSGGFNEALEQIAADALA